MQKPKLISIVAISLIILAIIIFKFLIPELKTNSNTASESPAQEQTIEAKAAPVAVEAVPAHRGDLVIRISASGKTEAVHQIGIMNG
jgi:multidrug efflux pump subunit AcrA (membrane-fusion protein)